MKRLGEMVDGEFQKLVVESGAYVREHVFGSDPRLLEDGEGIPDEKLRTMRLGGHDPRKVYAAYKEAVEHAEEPTVILARTIKGYGLGESGEGKNVTHQQKKVDEEELRHFRKRFGFPSAKTRFADTPFYRPPDTSPEIEYLQARRQELGGYLPRRRVRSKPLVADHSELFQGILRPAAKGAKFRRRWLSSACCEKCCATRKSASSWFRSFRTKRAHSAWSRFSGLSGFTAAGANCTNRSTCTRCFITRKRRTARFWRKALPRRVRCRRSLPRARAYATHGINAIPFFIYYSMFGLQRIGDLIWAAADTRCRGFLLGGTAGRTTLSGEGLQHQDGNSHVLALPIPTLQAYDPAFAYEVATIIEDGIERMYKKGENIFYYITVMNEPYAMPAMPEGSREGILKGMYVFRAS